MMDAHAGHAKVQQALFFKEHSKDQFMQESPNEWQITRGSLLSSRIYYGLGEPPFRLLITYKGKKYYLCS